MNAARADAMRRASERLSQLLDRAEGIRLRNLGFDELRELGRLYRLHAAHLAGLRDHGDDPDEIRHVNALCVRAFGILYGRSGAAQQRSSSAQRLRQALARTWRAQLLAWMLLASGALLGAGLVRNDPAAFSVLIPESLGYSDTALEELARSPDARRRFLAGEETQAASKAVFGSTLFVHNTTVGLLGFATGMLAAVPTALIQIFNGMTVGALSFVSLGDPSPVPYLAWILPHAIPELTALSMCAAGGLLLGNAVVAPGRRGRAAALREAADPALLLFVGALPLFGVAALIEGFARESSLGTAPRLGLAAILAAAVVWCHVSLHRIARSHAADTTWMAALIAPDRSAAGGSG